MLAEQLNAAATWNFTRDPGTTAFSPNIDRFVVPEVPAARYLRGEQLHIPLLAGWNEQVSTARTLMETQPEAARLHLQNAEALAYQVQQELTALIQSSRPSVLSEKGLATALQEYVTTWSRQQQIPVQQHVEACTFPSLMEEALLRVTQEALSNIARHSHASAVTLVLSCTQDPVTLTLEDNGCGFDPDDPALAMKNGVGLQSMRERIEAFGGTIRIESRDGEGTRIFAYCPYPNWKESHGEAPFMVPLLPEKEVPS